MIESRIEHRRRTNIRDSYVSVVAFVLVGIGFFSAYKLTMPDEDAVILFEYAKNLATRGVITYGAQSVAPVEGATDFLYMTSIALMSRFGISEFGAALILNYLGVLLLCYLLRRAKLSIGLIGAAILATPYLYASLLGFSATAFSAVYLSCLYLLIKNDTRVYPATLILCLIRPDGVAWGAGLVLTRFLKLNSTDLRSETVRVIKYLIIPGIVYFVWRAWYFDEWLPLPFLVKASGEKYFSDSLGYIAPIIVSAIAAILCAEDKTTLIRRSILLYSLPVLLYSAMRLEQNVGDRFLAPMFFGFLLLFATEAPPRASKIFLVCSIYLSWQFTSDTVNSVLVRRDRAHEIALKLRQLAPGKILTTEAGQLAYYSNWAIQDSWGLNSPQFAHNLITEGNVKNGSYDLIVAHCEITLLKASAEHEIVGRAQRTWRNQCIALTGFIRNSDYDILLVPIVEAPLESRYGTTVACVLHFIYAVSPKYQQARQLEGSLLELGAVPFDGNGHFYVGDSVCPK